MSLKTIPVIVALTDPHGSPVEGARVVAQLVTSADGIPAFDVDVATGVVVPSRVVATTAVTGIATLNLWPNELGSYATAYIVEASYGARTLMQTTISVPDMDPVAATHIENLIQVPPFPSVDASQQALAAVQAATAFVVANADASAASAAAASDSEDAAAASAATATAQAGIATVQAGLAADSASAAANSENAAAASEATATQQAGIATTQAGIATAQAVIAATKAGEASASAAAALASEQAAADSETASAASASTATTQAGIATTQAGIAATQAGIAATKASEANTSAGNAAGSAAQALAIYGSVTAQQTAVSNAQAAASLAQGYAASASSVVQQDLSGVSAAALHRSPNAVTAMFVYDTSKDSDGGAWTKRCQHTSWYNEALNGKWLGAAASESAARAVSGATTGDYFQLTTDGKFYRLNAGSGTTEVFRGNKAEFPKVAAIVSERNSGTNLNSMTIYDLTEPGRPMWMRFTSTGTASGTGLWWATSPSASAVAACSGILVLGIPDSSTNGGLLIADFGKDILHRVQGFGAAYNRSGFRVSQRLQSGAMPLQGYTPFTGQLPSSTVNALAMTVLPDAPVDPVTGLKAPTIAVATAGGVSVIKHDGTVANVGTANNQRGISIFGKSAYVEGVLGSIYQSWTIDDLSKGASALIVERSPGRLDNTNALPAFVAASSRGHIGSVRQPGGMALSAFNRTTNTGALTAHIMPTYNTGYMLGRWYQTTPDTRRVYLADATAETVTGPELVTNGTFDTADGWAIPGGAQAIADGVLTSTSTGSKTAWNTGGQSLVAGKAYVATWDQTHPSGATGTRINVGYPADNISGEYVNGNGQKRVVFIAPASGKVGLFRYDGNVTIDNFSVKEVVADRSYKAQGASIFGSLTKSAVATGSQLVAYSGFSAANYLREPYSADLDFGTGEWSVGAWVNVPASLPVVSFPVIGSELVTNGSFDTDLTGWTIAAGTPTWESGAVRFNAAGQDFRQTISTVAGKTYRLQFTCSGSGFTNSFINVGSSAGGNDLANGFLSASHVQYFVATGDSSYLRFLSSGTVNFLLDSVSITEVATARIADRAHSSGALIMLGVTGLGRLQATAFDGTTTRTVTSTASYNTATWTKVRVTYRAGRLALTVNGVEVAVVHGAPLLTLNNASAVLTIGNSFALDAPFPGSIALLKLGATVPTPEQAVWMYEQERQMFREGAQVCLPDSGSIVDLTYDDATDTWIAASAANESRWTGLVRTGVTAAPAGSFSKVVANSGIKLQARTTTNPGVDVTIPAYGLREELVRRAEAAARLSGQLATYDYVGGFTATTTNGGSSLTSVAGLSVPGGVSLVGCQITGSGIPAGTTITGISGTTIYMSAAATAGASNVQVSLTDFPLPVGYEARVVMSAGAVKREGSTSDFVRNFDGFRETIRFAVAPGYTAWIQVQAARSTLQ